MRPLAAPCSTIAGSSVVCFNAVDVSLINVSNGHRFIRSIQDGIRLVTEDAHLFCLCKLTHAGPIGIDVEHAQDHGKGQNDRGNPSSGTSFKRNAVRTFCTPELDPTTNEYPPNDQHVCKNKQIIGIKQREHAALDRSHLIHLCQRVIVNDYAIVFVVHDGCKENP